MSVTDLNNAINISKSVTDLNNAINSDLQDLTLWLQGNTLTLNAVKKQSMIFGTEPDLRRIHRRDGSQYLNKFSSLSNK